MNLFLRLLSPTVSICGGLSVVKKLMKKVNNLLFKWISMNQQRNGSDTFFLAGTCVIGRHTKSGLKSPGSHPSWFTRSKSGFFGPSVQRSSSCTLGKVFLNISACGGQYGRLPGNCSSPPTRCYLVREAGADGGLDALVQIRVSKDQGRVFAPQLQRELFTVGGAELRYEPSRRRGAGEGDERNLRVAD